MYSFGMVASTRDHHGGFYTVWFLVTIISVAYFFWQLNDSKKHPDDREFGPKSKVIIPAVLIVSMMIAGFVSYNTGTVAKNEPVVAYLVKSAEALENTKVSKHRYEDIPKMFVIYRVPEGEVTFPRRSGIVYPDVVTLYKN